jgi:cellulose synthase/poly-beta-1,6-N-acetylglucosamine synthase-like glycosyltransferase
MLILYILTAVVILQGIISLLDGRSAIRHLRTYRPTNPSTPRVIVFCPCRGIDPDFRKNVSSILNQDYDAFSVIFIVDSEKDPAYQELQTLGARVLVAGPAANCGQKVHNLLWAVNHVGSDFDVLVFCDSDARYPRRWIRDLIAPLNEAGVGASTGYRWYAVQRFHLPTILRSVWNASVVTQFGGHNRNIAWGGSMALRRDAFEEMRVQEFWSGSISDDYGVTRAVRSAGRRIAFVPTCLIPSYGECTWSELLEFTTRQVFIVRIYDPRTWRMLLVAQFLYTGVFWTLFALMWSERALALLWFVLLALSVTKAANRVSAVAEALPDPTLLKYRCSYILWAPFIATLYVYNIVRSAWSRKIVWRQIHYHLKSPNYVVVRRGASES